MSLLVDSETALELAQVIHERVGGRVRNLRVFRRDGQLVVEGSSHSFYAKQLATHAVLEFGPCEDLINEIVVDSRGPTS